MRDRRYRRRLLALICTGAFLITVGSLFKVDPAPRRTAVAPTETQKRARSRARARAHPSPTPKPTATQAATTETPAAEQDEDEKGLRPAEFLDNRPPNTVTVKKTTPP